MFGAFIENGPYVIDGEGNWHDNPYAWNIDANVLYIDSPPGTGFSTTQNENGYDSNEFAVAQDLYNALQGFYKYDNGRYQQLPAFYISGESYAGKHISKQNKALLTLCFV